MNMGNVNVCNLTTKMINELEPLGKISGENLVLIDNGEQTFKTTVDSLLGYIAKEVNKGTIPDTVFKSSSIIEIPVDEEIDTASRVDGNYYLRTCNIDKAHISAGIDSTIIISPNMALKIIED